LRPDVREGDLLPGARVGPYEIVSLLGEGGMGQVFRARDTRLSRDVALKMFRPDAPVNKNDLGRFADEAKAASLLSHPNIVAVYDVGDEGGSPYIISELLEGESLRERLAAGPLLARKAVEYGIQVLRGLAAAHGKGIVHRDLKPENLFLTKDGLVKILDFGIAKLGRRGEGHDRGVEAPFHTVPGLVLGTVGYMSPEQVRGHAVDHRSDLFSFGAVLYEMLTGTRAFRGGSAAETLDAVLSEDPLGAAATGIPVGLVRVIQRSLEKSPEDRFQTAGDLAFHLEGAAAEGSPEARERASALRRRMMAFLPAIVSLALVAGALGVWFGRKTAPVPAPPYFQRLTFRPGQVYSARFAPDGETILYSAKWGNGRVGLFSTRAHTRGERSLSLPDALILGISSREELALLLRTQHIAIGAFEGTLARAPMAGGATREILERVIAADWSPDGKDLAVIHVVEGERHQLEYPVGQVLYSPDPPVWLSNVRVSPNGDSIAFQEHPVPGDNGGSLALVDRKGRRRTLASGLGDLAGLSWSPKGEEVWFATNRAGRMTAQQIQAISVSGQRRVLAELPANCEVLDVSRTRQVLGSLYNGGTEVRARARGASEEVELPAADYAFLSDLSDDGKFVLGTDTGEGGGPNFSFYVQKTDGSPPVWLGEGDGQTLSPDGRFALAVLAHAQPQRLTMVPVGAGESRILEPGGVVQYQRAVWDHTGRRVVFSGTDGQKVTRLYVQDVAGGAPRAVTRDDVRLGRLGRPVSPDDQGVVAVGPDEIPAIYPLAGGEPLAVPGLGALDVPLCWTPDGRALIVARYEESEDVVPRVEWLEVKTGKTRPWSRLARAAPSGLMSARVLVTPDGESYAYGYLRAQIDLYLSSELR
jgi:Tol biopolymer transport system component